MPELTDTHCHIQSIGLTDQGEETTRKLWQKTAGLTADRVIADALDAGVTRMLCVGCESEDSRLAVAFAKDRPNCWASVGIHPHEARAYAGNSQKLHEFAALCTRPKVVAVGECGLDYFYEHSPK